MCAGAVVGGRAEEGHSALGRALAGGLAAATHACSAQDSTAGGRGEKSSEQQHSAQVSHDPGNQYRRRNFIIE